MNDLYVKEVETKWYYKTIVIVIISACWPFLIFPIIIAIKLATRKDDYEKYYKSRRKTLSELEEQIPKMQSILDDLIEKVNSDAEEEYQKTLRDKMKYLETLNYQISNKEEEYRKILDRLNKEVYEKLQEKNNYEEEIERLKKIK